MRPKANPATCRMLNFSLFDSSIGELGLVWKKRGTFYQLYRIVLPQPEISTADLLRQRLPQAQPKSVPEAVPVTEAILAFLKTGQCDIVPEYIDMEQCGFFQQKVLNVTREIPAGRVISYGETALLTGHPNAGRAVGSALARNPFPLIFPCHRIVKANGKTGQFANNPALKRQLLELEGIRLNQNNMIPRAYFIEAQECGIMPPLPA